VLSYQLDLLDFAFAFLKKRNLKNSSLTGAKYVPHFKSHTRCYQLIGVEKAKHRWFVISVHEQTIKANQT